MDRRAVGGVHTGALARSLAELSLGTMQAAEERKAADWQDASDEYDQQFRLPLRFTVVDQLVTAQADVVFDVAFSNPTGRDGVETPLFTYGFEHQAGTPMLLSAYVMAYQGGPTFTTGATIAVSAYCPQPPGHKKRKLTWAGWLHANFQGWATPADDDYQDDED